jgi:hypothetical protein
MWCALLVTLSSWLPPAPLQATSLQAEDERAQQAFSALPRAEQQEVLDWMSAPSRD